MRVVVVVVVVVRVVVVVVKSGNALTGGKSRMTSSGVAGAVTTTLSKGPFPLILKARTMKQGARETR
jgi:hypothetical protein